MNFLKNSETHQLHVKPAIEKIHQPIISKHVKERIEIDLIDLNNIKGWNDRCRYILTAVDHFSKYAWAFPLTQKTDEKVYEILSKFIKENKPIIIIQSDNGKEFVNKKISSLLKDNHIVHITSNPYSPRSNGLVERFNRTIKGLIFKSMQELRTKRFIDILNQLMTNYNTTWHSTIKDSPSAVFHTNLKEEIQKARQNIKNYAKSMIRPDNKKFKKGDYVRISLLTLPEHKKDKFRKKYFQNWSKEIYIVDTVSKGPIRKYGLVNLDQEPVLKIYYYDQLQKLDPNNLLLPKMGQTKTIARKLKKTIKS